MVCVEEGLVERERTALEDCGVERGGVWGATEVVCF
jgi:hypothetical protein